MIAMIGTSDRLCWLAETCKILLLLLQMVRIWWAPCMSMQCLAELPGHTDQVCGIMLNASFSCSVALSSRP